jgi:hypothetical protein
LKKSLLEKVTSIRDGQIRDPDSVRRILRDAETAVSAELKRAYDERAVLDEAKAAFLDGWPERGLGIVG